LGEIRGGFKVRSGETTGTEHHQMQNRDGSKEPESWICPTVSNDLRKRHEKYVGKNTCNARKRRARAGAQRFWATGNRDKQGGAALDPAQDVGQTVKGFCGGAALPMAGGRGARYRSYGGGGPLENP